MSRIVKVMVAMLATGWILTALTGCMTTGALECERLPDGLLICTGQVEVPA